MATKKLNNFDKGILIAVSILMHCHDCPVMAADVLLETGLYDADVSTFEEFDKRQFRKLNKERNINLKGS